MKTVYFKLPVSSYVHRVEITEPLWRRMNEKMLSAVVLGAYLVYMWLILG